MRLMRYSEVKAIVQKLKAAGYEKYPYGYQKVWKQGDLRCGASFDLYSLVHSNEPIDFLIEQVDKEVRHKLSKAITMPNPLEKSNKF